MTRTIAACTLAAIAALYGAIRVDHLDVNLAGPPADTAPDPQAFAEALDEVESDGKAQLMLAGLEQALVAYSAQVCIEEAAILQDEEQVDTLDAAIAALEDDARERVIELLNNQQEVESDLGLAGVRVKQAQGEITARLKEAGEETSKITGAEAEIAAAETDLADLKSQRAKLAGQLTERKARLADLQSEAKNLQTQIEYLRARINRMENQAKEIQNDLNTLRADKARLLTEKASRAAAGGGGNGQTYTEKVIEHNYGQGRNYVRDRLGVKW